MGYPNTIWKVIYLVSAVAVGAGCFYAFIFFAFNIGGGFLGKANKPAAFGVAILAIAGILLLLFIGWFIYQSASYIGPTIGIIIVAAILTPSAIDLGSDTKNAIQKNRAKPYVESYLGELSTSLSERLTTIDFDYTESRSETLRHWNDKIRVELSKIERTQPSREELKNVMDAIPPAKYDVRVSIYYGSKEHALNGQFTLAFTIQKDLTAPPYCYSDDYENNPCHIVEELLAK